MVLIVLQGDGVCECLGLLLSRMFDIILATWQGLGRASSAMRGHGAVLWCCCLAACLASAAQARRELLITDQQAQSALDTVFSSAGDIVGQV